MGGGPNLDPMAAEAWQAQQQLRNVQLPGPFALIGGMAANPTPLTPFPPEARAKARDLLLAHLDEQQRANFEQRQYFDVVKDTRRYRIQCCGPVSHNIKLLDEDGREKASFCCYPADAGAIPPEDVWLAQKLNIEAAEADFLITAVKAPFLNYNPQMWDPQWYDREWHERERVVQEQAEMLVGPEYVAPDTAPAPPRHRWAWWRMR